MRLFAVGILGLALGALLIPSALAVEKPVSELPKDVKDVATVWTEPIKSVVEESRQSDPIRALGVGLFRGTVKALERTVRLFLPDKSEPSKPGQEPEKLLEYTF